MKPKQDTIVEMYLHVHVDKAIAFCGNKSDIAYVYAKAYGSHNAYISHLDEIHWNISH
jgi:hypothetical protein